MNRDVALAIRGARGVWLRAVVTLHQVLVLRESDSSLLCRIEGHDRWIPRDKLCEGSTVRRLGDLGTIVVPRPFAVEWGLTPYDEDA